MLERDLLTEQAYKQTRVDELVWKHTRSLGLSRKRFLQLVAAGAGTLAGSLTHARLSQPAIAADTVIKSTPPDLFYSYGSNREMRWENLYSRGYLVPNELFFVRNHTSTPQIDSTTWRLRVEGSAIKRPTTFSYEDLLALPSVSVTRAIECAGNGRHFFEAVQGKKAPGSQWRLGAIGVAEWTGVPLREVLDRVGVQQTARDVMLEGLDEKRVRRPIPITKAMADDTLLVYAMNGQVLPPDHGFPFRALVPGWPGVANIKWIGRIEVSDQPLFSPWNTEDYVMIGAAYPPQSPSKGPIVTSLNVKSAFELAWDAKLLAGAHLLRGRSWSAHGTITKVEVSLDNGKTWQLARLRDPNISQAWVRWDINWNARPGNYNLQARATDDQGNTQPVSVPFNEKGYLYGAVISHPVSVSRS